MLVLITLIQLLVTAFIRSRFGINVIDTGYDVCLHNIIGTQLTEEQKKSC